MQPCSHNQEYGILQLARQLLHLYPYNVPVLPKLYPGAASRTEDVCAADPNE